MNSHPNPSGSAVDSEAEQIAKKLGMAAFVFFLVKGLLWLVVPVLYLWFAAESMAP